MVKRAARYLWASRYELVKYGIVGFSGVFLDMLTLFFFVEILVFVPVLAVVCNQMIVMVYNFSLNKYWSFRNKEIPHKQLIRYLILAGANYLFSVVMMYIFNTVGGHDPYLVRIGSIAVMVSWNFFLYKHWVYT